MEVGSLNSMTTVFPKRLPPVLQDNTSTPTDICRCYGIRNSSLVRISKY